jgi:hypothetical protein
MNAAVKTFASLLFMLVSQRWSIAALQTEGQIVFVSGSVTPA